MPGKYEEIIYKVLHDEPVTPNEVALKLKITQKTAQKTLMQLANQKRCQIQKLWKNPSLLETAFGSCFSKKMNVHLYAC
jgi:predicted ArsR family transcriptional regulator